jgi:hypothetical protein
VVAGVPEGLAASPPEELLQRAFRANPRYELVLFDRLSAGERRRLEGFRRDPGFYGVLRPRDEETMGVKAVDRETALLFLTLREPGPLPAYVRETLGEGTARTLAQLLADGVLEVEHEGGFASGAVAFALLPSGPAGEAGEPRGRLARLSLAAIRHAEALALDEPLQLAWRLYAYNRRPLTPRWQRLLPSAEAVREYLGIGARGANRPFLDRVWTPGAPTEGWLSWTARSSGRPDRRPETAAAGGTTYKLYVSPRPELLREGFGAVLEALAASRARQFKVGAGAVGLLRPDKIVAYFPDFERLAEAADAVLARLAGVAAQGVPFTSEIGGEGLISWGVDPPAGERSSLWDGRESWRLWLSHRLARALLTARAAETQGVEPWRFALERLRLEGVDTTTWTPGALLWKEP